MAFDPSTVISARLDRLAAIAELIYFPDDVIAEHERRPAAHRLWVEVPSDHHVRVGQARGEHAYSHLAPPGCRQRGIKHLQPVRTAEAPHLDNVIVPLPHGRTSLSDSRSRRHSLVAFGVATPACSGRPR